MNTPVTAGPTTPRHNARSRGYRRHTTTVIPNQQENNDAVFLSFSVARAPYSVRPATVLRAQSATYRSNVHSAPAIAGDMAIERRTDQLRDQQQTNRRALNRRWRAPTHKIPAPSTAQAAAVQRPSTQANGECRENYASARNTSTSMRSVCGARLNSVPASVR